MSTIYQDLMMKADILLHIFGVEKSKRGRFTYKRMPQANKEPAEESIANAKTFFRSIFQLCKKNSFNG